MSAADPVDALRCELANLAVDAVLHEVRRAVVLPVAPAPDGAVAASQAIGLWFGWLAPAGNGGGDRLAATDSGRRALMARRRRPASPRLAAIADAGDRARRRAIAAGQRRHQPPSEVHHGS